RGRAPRPAAQTHEADQPNGSHPIDTHDSPIRRGSYTVEAARVGQRTDFDKLTLDLETDGSIEPNTALREASEILIKTLAIFTDPDRVEELTAKEPGVEASEADVTSDAGPDGDILIDELELSVRSYNCLKRAGVETIGQLVTKSESELQAIPNFGQKSIEEVIDTLKDRGYQLRGA
ncbi:MAG: DNA-directed RNA polymerase subunit alpha C-terminal domain-containing protein, partial [Solirubrobacterales bacterium]